MMIQTDGYSRGWEIGVFSSPALIVSLSRFVGGIVGFSN